MADATQYSNNFAILSTVGLIDSPTVNAVYSRLDNVFSFAFDAEILSTGDNTVDTLDFEFAVPPELVALYPLPTNKENGYYSSKFTVTNNGVADDAFGAIFIIDELYHLKIRNWLGSKWNGEVRIAAGTSMTWNHTFA
jgi:hypothetical protein